MGLFSNLKRFFASRPPDEEEEAFDPELFVYIRIPAPIEPIERGERFEDPLHEALEAASLGGVSGGGSSLGDERPDGTRSVEWCGIDVDVTNLEEALALMREKLPNLGLPGGSKLEYTMGAAKLQDRFSGSAWSIGERRSNHHPGFGV